MKRRYRMGLGVLRGLCLGRRFQPENQACPGQDPDAGACFLQPQVYLDRIDAEATKRASHPYIYMEVKMKITKKVK